MISTACQQINNVEEGNCENDECKRVNKGGAEKVDTKTIIIKKRKEKSLLSK
jgi:hypothetical protein